MERTHIRAHILLLLAGLVLLLNGCAPSSQVPPSALPSPSAAVSERAERPTPPPPTAQPSEAEPEEPTEPVVIAEPEDIQEVLYAAISEIRQPPAMDISQVSFNQTPEIDVKNLYYGLTKQYPELKYAYDVSPLVEGDLLIRVVSYMPYKTGDYPAEDSALSAATLQELIAAAQTHMGEASFPIRITDPTLPPDHINLALQQVGGGYILCALNRDGTQITCTPAMGTTLEECLAMLDEADRLAGEVAAQLVTDSTTDREKAEALYAYLTAHVQYDQRYYSDRVNILYESHTAVGALRDGQAICGGYAHALKLLFEHAGIPCYNVTGKYFSEPHMWNVAQLDGEWLWFDATIDRGSVPEFGFLRFGCAALPEQYHWDEAQIARLF